MFVHYRTEGLFLKKKERGEADQLFSVYTKDYGKIDILGRGIRKIKSKLRAGADIFYLSNIEFIQGKAYKTLTNALLIDKFSGIRKNPLKLKISNKISDAIESLIPNQEKDRKIWDLLLKTFNNLNVVDIKKINPKLFFYYFLGKFLTFLGYQPELHNCASCHKKLLPGPLFFSVREGGIICSQCFQGRKEGEEILLETIKILRFIIEKDWPTVSRLKFDIKYLKDLGVILDSYLASLAKSAISDH